MCELGPPPPLWTPMFSADDGPVPDGTRGRGSSTRSCTSGLRYRGPSGARTRDLSSSSSPRMGCRPDRTRTAYRSPLQDQRARCAAIRPPFSKPGSFGNVPALIIASSRSYSSDISSLMTHSSPFDHRDRHTAGVTA